jgi:hypothetical protein
MFQPLFESRHAFMQACQHNHWQFSSLRNAKHATMSIIYHLHMVQCLPALLCT